MSDSHAHRIRLGSHTGRHRTGWGRRRGGRWTGDTAPGGCGRSQGASDGQVLAQCSAVMEPLAPPRCLDRQGESRVRSVWCKWSTVESTIHNTQVWFELFLWSRLCPQCRLVFLCIYTCIGLCNFFVTYILKAKVFQKKK